MPWGNNPFLQFTSHDANRWRELAGQLTGYDRLRHMTGQGQAGVRYAGRRPSRAPSGTRALRVSAGMSKCEAKLAIYGHTSSFRRRNRHGRTVMTR